MKKLLIVEDDDFKLQEIQELIQTGLPGRWQTTVATAMSTAVAEVNNQEFDFVILDMSIPSHPRERGTGAALPLTTGGLEIIFEMESLGKDGRCLILTQFPEIEIEGTLVPLLASSEQIWEKFQCAVIDCVHYSEDSNWKLTLTQALIKYENPNT